MAAMTHWTENRYYSLQHDSEMARISGFDDRCQEHWTEIQTGALYRDRRMDAIESIQEHIERGDPAGEVLKGD